MIASLPMYDFEELTESTDQLWSAVARQLRARGLPAPFVLTRPATDLLGHWRRTDTVLTQACGYPYRAWLKDTLAVVGTFSYGAAAPRGQYRSVVIARRDDERSLSDLAGSRVAANGSDSLTGWVSLGAALAEAGVTRIGSITITGAHAKSVAAVGSGAADVAAIDAVTWAILSRRRPTLTAGLRVVGAGPLIACPPLLTACRDHVEAVREAVRDALDVAPPEALAALGIDGFVPLDQPAYDNTLQLAERAATVLAAPSESAPQAARC